MKKLYTLGLALAIAGSASAQGTYELIYGIFQANCTVGCHSGSSPSANLNLKESGDMAAVYDNIVGVNPINPAALAKGYKLINKGYPERSFLLRKCATPSWDAAITLELAEGNSMPDGPGALDEDEIELIRQWINFDAPETGSVVDPQLLHDYYNGLGMDRIEIPLTPEEEGLSGYQVHMGPFFLEPLSEVEYRWKYDLQEPDSLEVYRTESFFNDESHHFILYKFGSTSAANNVGTGYRAATLGELFSFDLDQVTAWQDPLNNELPDGAAYKWQSNTVLDNNYHILNYDADSVLAAEAYINVYTQPIGTADVEMLSVLIPINALEALIGNGSIGQDLIIPNDGQPHTFTYPFAIPIQVPDWHIWNLWAHTHATGVDYDVYLRNANGTKGQQIYEGFYDPTYTFPTGSFDWAHPPLRHFDPLLQVNMSNGLIQEAVYVNNTTDTIRWGLTTEDEMMLISVQYTEAPLPVDTGGTIGIEEGALGYFNASPNPFADYITVHYKLNNPSKVTAELYDIYGRHIRSFSEAERPAGRHKLNLDLSSYDLAEGTYLLRFSFGGETITKRLVHTSR